ncbi:MAG: hypothetical protein RL885_26850 [Planctomycetota bacterium]
MRLRLFVLLATCVGVLGPEVHAQRQKRVPSGRSLDKIAEEYLEADEKERARFRREMDREYRPIERDRDLEKTRERLIELVRRHPGKQIETSGTHDFYPEKKSGKYIVRGANSDTLFIGLHGGGVGSGDAEGMASAMGGGGFVWIFPEVLEKTERGWVDSGTDRFVLELVEAAKRTFPRIDPNKIYVAGHSMGGHGTWSFAAHFPDIFAGGAAYAGGPSPYYRARGDSTIVAIEEGLLPNLYRQRFLCFQSSDDPRVPPEPNDFAMEKLKSWKQRFPDGFDHRYVRVDDRGHSAPAEGYLPTLEWIAEKPRDPRPKHFLWQPVLDWQQDFYWLHWERPLPKVILEVKAEDNIITLDLIEGEGELGRFTLFLGDPIVDLDEEVVVVAQGKELFRGKVEKTLSNLLWTLPRNDPGRLFAASLELNTHR